jgi:hypothetical protein
MTYFHVRDSISVKNHKAIFLDENIYETINTRIDGSYNILYARIFGLTYPEFLKMVRDLYNATLYGRGQGYTIFTFENLYDAQKFANECNIRWRELINK